MNDQFSIEYIKSRITKDKNGISNYMNVSIEEMDWLLSRADYAEFLENELEEMTDDRNMWRSNSLDWEGNDDFD